MTASRGDTKPCTALDCAGTMQFGRRGDSDARTPALRRPADRADVAMDAKGWVCKADPAHFRQDE
jgi:hypothetical protein